MKFKPSRALVFFSIIALWLIGLSGCSTKRNTAAARAYHNLTSHYNVYWNGMHNMQEGILYLQENTKDNYQHILRLYNYGGSKLARQMKSKMNRTIKKASKGIQQHSMVFNGQERIRWVTESYLMMGQAHFYEHDYVSARRVFNFVSRKYIHLPIHYRGILWLAKTDIETGDFGRADAALNLLSSQETADDFPIEVKNKLPLVQADFYLAKKNTAVAYPFLEKSLRVCKDRDLLSRILFIMGQINQKEGDLKLATNFYRKVIKRNPPFDMAFEARLNLATSYDAANGDRKYILATLEKMAKKHQYIDYLDQIYFALAEVAEKNHQDSLEVLYLKRSVSNSKKNNYQKSSSSLKLAKLLFNTGKYVIARAYYDTAVRFLPKDYPAYDQIKEKAGILSQMVTYLQTIHLQDSLQHLARMDSSSLYALVDKKIATYQAFLFSKKKEAEIAGENTANAAFPTNSHSPTGFMPGNGGWYFYNTAAKSRGYSEFLRRWGHRKLEDLWFLSDKQIVAGSPEESDGELTTKERNKKQYISPEKDPTNRAFYLKNLPKTKQEFQFSDSLITNSFHKLGFLYLEELHDTTRALEIYSLFEKRFPNNPYQLENWYHLYKIYSGIGKDSLGDIFKQQILESYPNSLYAKVISNPDFYKNLSRKHEEAEKFYQRTYEAFQQEQYYRVLIYARRALSIYADDSLLIPKFMFLQALSIGKVEVPDSLYTSLQHLVKKYPNNKITIRAKDIIKMLQQDYGIGISEQERQALLNRKKKKQGIGPYLYEENSLQYVMLVYDRASVQTRSLITRISDFNQKYLRQQPLQINNLTLDVKQRIITIGKFKADEAKAYYRALGKNAYVFSGIQKKKYRLFIISVGNYPLFYRDKKLEIYQQFFNKYYHQPDQTK